MYVYESCKNDDGTDCVETTKLAETWLIKGFLRHIKPLWLDGAFSLKIVNTQEQGKDDCIKYEEEVSKLFVKLC